MVQIDLLERAKLEEELQQSSILLDLRSYTVEHEEIDLSHSCLASFNGLDFGTTLEGNGEKRCSAMPSPLAYSALEIKEITLPYGPCGQDSD